MRIEYILNRDIFGESVKKITEKGVVIDAGSSAPFNGQLSRYKSLFKNIRYYALDINFHPELDIIADIQNLPLKNNCIEAVICRDVLEHVPEPFKAIEEIHRILNKGGLLFISIPFLYPYHAAEGQKDLYRFTKDGLEYMFRDFGEMKLQPCGGYINTTLNFMTGFKFRNCFFIDIFEKPLSILLGFLRRKAINSLHHPAKFNILLKK